MKTNKEELAHRNYHWQSKSVRNLNVFLTGLLSKKYNCEYHIIDDINEEPGPAFVIFNHLSRFDHLFITQIMKPRRYNMVAAHNEFFRFGQHFFFQLGSIIPKTNFSLDITTMKAIKKVIGQGGTVCFAPEGMTPMDGLNHPVVPGTGRMFKKYNIPVYQIELRGQFMIASKVCLDERLGGKCSATLRKLYAPEDLQKMTAEEIDADLNQKMRHDEFEWQKEHHYKYDLKGQSCKNLKDLCYLCPKCGKMFTMKSEGNKIYCTSCGNGTTMDDYYDFHPFENSVIPETPAKWSELERIHVIKEIRAKENYSLTMKTRLGKLPEYGLTPGSKTSIPCGEGTVTVDHNGFHFQGTKDGKPFSFDRTYDTLTTILTPLDFKYFSIYDGSDFYDFFPEDDGQGKVGYLQHLIEEMHRLHVNKLKNFPWNDYMYQ